MTNLKNYSAISRCICEAHTLRKLKSLTLTLCNPNNAEVKALSTAVPYLEYLNFDCTSITSEG